MPGYQPIRVLQPSDYFPKTEPIYGHVKAKKKSKGNYPLFEDPKIRNARDKMNYLRSKDMVRTDPSGQRFDSLKLLGSCNDLNYLDSFMSMPRNRQIGLADEHHQLEENRPRARSIVKSASTVFGKGGGDKRNSIHSDSVAVTAAMLSSLRNSASEDNLYESVEMIHYLKTIQSLNRQKKTRSVQKTGHPLFDSLRMEQAMKEPIRKISSSKKIFDENAFQGLRSQEYSVSDENSPSHSSSGSGDELYHELHPRGVSRHRKISIPNKMMQYSSERKFSDEKQQKFVEKQAKISSKKKQNENGSESDDEFKIIPRPRLVGRGLLMQPQNPKQRRRGEITPPQSDESDSSFNSAVLR